MEVKQFAWLPIRVTSGERVWLEFYHVHRKLYDDCTGRPPLGSLYFTWTESKQERMLRILQGN